MIRVTIYNEHLQEQLDLKKFDFVENWHVPPEVKQRFDRNAKTIRSIHKNSIHDTLKNLLEEDPEISVRHIGTIEMWECGLTEDVLQDTDVLIWWSHYVQDRVPDNVAQRVARYVRCGMGVIFLHSAHVCKPMVELLGTSCSLRWREGDFCRVWNTCPTHPIAKGIPEYIELEEEEMYGEYFDIPKPDDVIFTSWFSGGELCRSGCTWTRGYGRIFYFQPGHETNYSYFNESIRQIIRNAVHWTAEPEFHLNQLDCKEIHGPMNNRA